MNIRNLIKGRLDLFTKSEWGSTKLARLTTLVIVVLYVPLLVFGQSSVDFAVIGDYGHAGSGERDVANLVKSWNPDFIITTGDNNYPDGAASTIDANIGQYYHDFIFPYIGTYGDGATTNRFFPSLGNHDWHAPDAQPYVNYFVLPGNERYYEFVRGPVHFFAIDSDENEVDGDTEGSEQGQWLKDRLASASEPWKIVYFHHPPYSSGHHGSTTRMRWHFKEWGASAVLSGHDHTYERLSVDGFPYFVDGLGGASRYGFETILPSSQVRYNDTYGAMLVNADGGSITFRFFNIEATLIDGFSLSNGAPSGVDAPTGLQARAVSANQVDMSWNDNSSNETGFEIDRCGAAGCSDFAEIARVAANVASYTDPSVSPGTYRYRVRAFNSTAESGYSNIVEISTAPATDVFSDDFDDSVIDLSKWRVGMFSRDSLFVDSLTSISEQDGRLKIIPGNLIEGLHYNGYVSVPTLDMTDGSASVEVVEAADNRAATIFAVGIDKNNWLAFRAKDGTLFVERRIDGVTFRDDLFYDKGSQRFWRIRHDGQNDEIVFETSADYTNWAVEWRVPRPFSLSAVRVELSAGTSDAIGSPGVALFDNVRLGPS